jgi:predicted nucleic acid-binding protein
MAIVVDTSTVIAVAGNEPIKGRLIEMTRGQELVAAATLPWEIGNAISAMFKQKRATLEQGLELAAQYRRIPILLMEVALGESLKIAGARNIYAYDAYVIQCALQTGYPILSLDTGLCVAARLAGVTVLEVVP